MASEARESLWVGRSEQSGFDIRPRSFLVTECMGADHSADSACVANCIHLATSSQTHRAAERWGRGGIWAVGQAD